jgi:hypothetical protein
MFNHSHHQALGLNLHRGQCAQLQLLVAVVAVVEHKMLLMVAVVAVILLQAFLGLVTYQVPLPLPSVVEVLQHLIFHKLVVMAVLQGLELF